MLVDIKFERSLNNKGEPRYKIVDWSNIRGLDELPNEYMTGDPYFYISNEPVDGDELIKAIPKGGGIKRYRKGDALTYAEYSEFISLMKAAGDRLSKINRGIKKITRKWTDKEFTVTI